MLENQHYIRRCHELAILGVRYTAPNPMVGSVILDGQLIIGEGWHRHYGEAHAEINALNSVQTANRHRIAGSTIFVSLEPCSIHGNTPLCTDAILSHKIQKVVVSSRDLTEGVKGVSEYILKDKKIDLTYGVDHALGDLIASPRNIFVSQKRPYIILKWAQSADGFIARENERTPISNPYTRRYVHKLRSEVGAIVIGNRTAIIDDPSLTTRFYKGENPLRVVLGDIDSESRKSLQLFNDEHPTIVIGRKKRDEDGNIQTALCNEMYNRNIQKILIEGGATTLQRFIDTDLWDECRIITNARSLDSGTKAPRLPKIPEQQSFHIMDDHISIYHNIKSI